MHAVTTEIALQRQSLAAHPFLRRLEGPGTFEQARAMIPRLGFFVLAFQDVLRLVHQRCTVREISELTKTHWDEDTGHDLWYLQDLERLGIPFDIRWLFSEEHRLARDVGYGHVATAIDASDDRVRLAVALALEGVGAEFFGRMIGFLERLGRAADLRYFARSHQQVEAEHEVFESTSQARLAAIPLDGAVRDEAVDAVRATFARMRTLADDLVTAMAAAVAPGEIGGVAIDASPEALTAAREDFGHMVRGNPRGVVRPRDVSELAAVVREARARSVKLTPRGGGLGQSGQSVASSGLTLELGRLATVGEPDLTRRTIRVGPGASWRAIAARTAPLGLLPPVMPLNLDLTVGGTLSAGGFGSSSHRFGIVASHVAGATVVTGSGEPVRCGPREERALFDAVFGGLGRVGVIAEVELQLRSAAPRVRTVVARYSDLDGLLADAWRLQSNPSVAHLELSCHGPVVGLRAIDDLRRPHIDWSFCLHVGVEAEPEGPAHPVISDGLAGSVLYSDEDGILGHASRYEQRHAFMRATGAWAGRHPWFEVILPSSTASSAIRGALERLPPFFGDGHRILLFADTDRPRSVAFPDEGPAVGFAVLPAVIPEACLDAAVAALRAVHASCIEAGGKRYGSGWLFEPGPEDWRRHYGAAYAELCEADLRYDPAALFESRLGKLHVRS
jgi:cytokinin dehydrogenase